MQAKKILSVICIVALSASAFKNFNPPTKIEEIRNQFLNNAFVTSFDREYYDVNSYPDTNIVFKNPEPENLSINKFTIKANYVGSTFDDFANSINKEEGIHSKLFDADFKKIFATSIQGNHVKMAQKNYDEKPSIFFFYSALGLKTAFDKMYVKPSSGFQGYALQKLYNLSYRKDVNETIRSLNKLLKNRAVFVQQSSIYLTRAKSDKNFNNYEIEGATYKRLVPTWKMEEDDETKYDSNSKGMLGSLMRRQCDGTLQTLIDGFKVFLKDYDPEALKTLKI